MRQYKYLTFQDRKLIAEWNRSGERPADTAKRLGVTTATIYRELKRGEAVGEGGAPVINRNQQRAYNPVVAQQRVQENFRRRGSCTRRTRKKGDQGTHRGFYSK